MILLYSVKQEKVKLESSLRTKVPGIQVFHVGSGNDVLSIFQQHLPTGIVGCLLSWYRNQWLECYLFLSHLSPLFNTYFLISMPMPSGGMHWDHKKKEGMRRVDLKWSHFPRGVKINIKEFPCLFSKMVVIKVMGWIKLKLLILLCYSN